MFYLLPYFGRIIDPKSFGDDDNRYFRVGSAKVQVPSQLCVSTPCCNPPGCDYLVHNNDDVVKAFLSHIA